MTDEQPSAQLDKVINLLSQALSLVNADNCTLVAAHIQMALDAASEQSRDQSR